MAELSCQQKRNAVRQRPEKKTCPKKLGKPKKDCFRRRDDVHAIFIRSLVYSRYGQDKNFIYTTQKKTLTKDNATYVRYKRPIAKKLI